MAGDERTESKRETLRLVVTVAVVGGLAVALRYTPLKHWFQEAQAHKALIASYGWRAHVCFILASVLGIALGVPRLLLCAAGGMLFGAWEGLLTSQFAGVLGAYGAFLLTRLWAPKEWVQRRIAGNERLRQLLSRPSVGTIFVARQLPIPGVVPNVLLGVLGTRHRTFLLGTFLGYLPSNIPIALLGSSMGKASLEKAFFQVSLSMCALAGFSTIILWIRRKVRASLE
ncbi:MAG: hypothetical protein RLZZ244_3060 [Verrucomicrobiota bacterium]|jgi:uncharacterized membrane protein YdjX (TVP38/TMEM64 family)